MKKITNVLWLLMVAFLLFSCSDDKENLPEPPPAVELKEGINLAPEALDALKEVKITFKAPKTSALYNYTGDVYVHIGIAEGQTWLFVPTDWNKNEAKYKMTKEADNVWSISLTPSIRQWFGAGEELLIQQLAIIFRSADGTKKGIQEDTFIPVTDNTFTPGKVVNEPQPNGTKEGINIVNATTATFVLYDQDKDGNHKEYAYLIGDFNNWKLDNKYQMKRDEATHCWWYTLSGLDAQKEYGFQYYVGGKDGALRLADAYSEKILDPANDKYLSGITPTYPEGKTAGIVSVLQTQPQEYSWKVNDFKATDSNQWVIYEMLFRDFTTSQNIAGATVHLDYLKSLGVNAIELMPLQEFDGNNSWGYNPCFYFAMDKAYGTKQQYKEFIDACHERGMAVILDVVYNHATGAHPFARLYWDGKSNKTAKNNPWFNIDAPHPYSVFHDFNHESPLVRAFVKRNLEFLLNEYHFDGFRFDLTKGFTQKASTEATASAYDASRIAILKEYNTAIKDVNPDACVILEHFCAESENEELAKAGMKLWRNQCEPFYQSGMGYSENSSFTGLALGSSMAFGGYVDYMESHDEERTGYKQRMWGSGTLSSNLKDRMNQLASNAAFFFTVAGPKMIWQFEELGYDYSINSKSDGSDGTDDNRTDPKPVKWDYYDNISRKGLYQTYSKLLSLRTVAPTLFEGTVTRNWKVSPTDWSNGRTLTLKSLDGKGLVVVGNFTDKAIDCTATFPSTGTWYNYMNESVTLSVTTSQQIISIPPHEFRLYTNFPSAK